MLAVFLLHKLFIQANYNINNKLYSLHNLGSNSNFPLPSPQPHRKERKIPSWYDTLLSCKTYLFFIPVYGVRVNTSNIDGAGTDATVIIKIYGDKGSTGTIRLNGVNDNFKKGR